MRISAGVDFPVPHAFRGQVFRFSRRDIINEAAQLVPRPDRKTVWWTTIDGHTVPVKQLHNELVGQNSNTNDGKRLLHQHGIPFFEASPDEVMARRNVATVPPPEDEDRRHRALTLAVALHAGRDGHDDAAVLRTAERFAAYLAGEQPAA